MFEKRSTRDIVASKRPIEETSDAQTKVAGKSAATVNTDSVQTDALPAQPASDAAEPVKTTKKPAVFRRRWILTIGGIIGLFLVIGLCLCPLWLRSQLKYPETTDSNDLSVIAVNADPALADFVAPGDVVRLYAADGSLLEPLQYVQVCKAQSGQLLLFADNIQASVLAAQTADPKIAAVMCREPETASQLLDLQVRINDPVITLGLPDAQLLRPDESMQLNFEVTVDPSEATQPPIQWQTSDEKVVVVQDGMIAAKGLGEAVVTVICGKAKAECTVTVGIPLESVALSQTEAVMGIGETLTLTAAPTPENTTDYAPSWSSDDPSVAEVTQDGTVTAVASGTTTITLTSGSCTAECLITVGQRADVVKLDKDTLSLKPGDTGILVGTVYPETDVIDTPAFTSSDTKIATIEPDGTVTAVSAGTCTILFKAGAAEAACKITVNP